MKDFLSRLREEEKMEKLCRDYGLSIRMVRHLTLHRNNGLSMSETARKMGIHMITIRRYDNVLRDMPKESAIELWNHCIRQPYETSIESL